MHTVGFDIASHRLPISSVNLLAVPITSGLPEMSSLLAVKLD